MPNMISFDTKYFFPWSIFLPTYLCGKLNHFLTNCAGTFCPSKFNFHKYIKRSLEDDFKVVVGIRSSFLNPYNAMYICFCFLYTELTWFFTFCLQYSIMDVCSYFFASHWTHMIFYFLLQYSTHDFLLSVCSIPLWMFAVIFFASQCLQ